MFTTILLDFDGTLVSSLDLWLEAYHYAFHKYDRTVPDDTIIQRCFFRDYDLVCEEFALPKGISLQGDVSDGLMIAFEHAKLCPGTGEFLKLCRNAGKTLGLVTSAPAKQVNLVLSNLGILSDFSTIIALEDVANLKPHPEPVLKALELLNRKPEETIFVGDYKYDVLASRAANVKNAIYMPEIHARFYDFPAIYASNPDFIFTEYSELSKYLRLIT